jgi:SAM-dependent methyltransferase
MRAGNGVESFDAPDAVSINRGRIDCLSSLKLNLRGKSVLDVGCGVGHLARFFVQQGCEVSCVDARPENIERLKSLYPDLQARVFDLERDGAAGLGTHDIVFAFGLLYHLENPFRALRTLSAAARELLLLETVVSDHPLPLVVMCEEPTAFNQAVENIGCRPTPSFVALALRSSGFPNVYAPRVLPHHADFQVEWKSDLTDSRDGHLLRGLFIASRHPLNNPNLVALLARP